MSVIYYEWSLGKNAHVLSIYGNVIWSSIPFTSNCTLTGEKLRPVVKSIEKLEIVHTPVLWVNSLIRIYYCSVGVLYKNQIFFYI